MVNYFAACDVFVLPSVTRSEAFAIVQLGAMAFGKPIVNTALDSGVPFVSQDGVTGVTVPPRDAGAPAKAIGEFLDDPERMRRLGRGGRQRFEKGFVRPAMVERVLAACRDVAGEG